MKKLSNISLRELRLVLTQLGLSKERTKGGHEIWSKEGLCRPVTFQTHKDPVPELVIKNIIRDVNVTRDQFLEILEEK